MIAAAIIAFISFMGGFFTAALLKVAKQADEQMADMRRDIDDTLGPEGPVYPRIDERV